MPTAIRQAVIATNLADATSFTGPRGGAWARLLISRDTPDYVRDLLIGSVAVTPLAMAADPDAVHELVRALSFANPGIEVHLPPMAPSATPTQAEIDQTRLELERDNDELHARRLLRQIHDRVAEVADAWSVWLQTVPSSRRTQAAQEAIRRRIRTGMTQADALRSVAADYAAGRLS